jgi:hypothetical protein
MPRSAVERKAGVVAKLTERHADVWVATASEQGTAHLIPLSLAWDGERVIVATERESLTTRNLLRSGQARLALGGTRDVVMIDAGLDETVPVAEAGSMADAYAAQADWDPRSAGGEFVFLVLRPVRIQSWREADEIAGRTLMRDGAWLV